MSKYTEQDRTYYRELIWRNALDLFNNKKNKTDKFIINSQKKYIDSFNMNYKNKYKSLDILNNYFKNPDKNLGEQIFWNTINKKIKY
jgi:hypothetical protein